MPGLVMFRRRWSVGSDDLVVPGVFLLIAHTIWTIVLGVLLGLVTFDMTQQCTQLLFIFIVVYIWLLGLNMANETAIAVVALRGSILDTAPRASMKYLLYLRFGLLLLETGWLVAGCAWLVHYYTACPIDKAKQTALVLVVCNWCVVVSIAVTVWCTFDAAGRSWVKMKKYQRSMRASESKFQYKRSGSTRNWRQRKVLRAYQDSWQQRCRLLFCCMRPSDRNRNSFADIARLLSDFFRDLDVVPSDVIAGLVLLRKFQKIERRAIVEQRRGDTYEFLSGAAITPRTHFLALHDGADLQLFESVIHFAHFAVRAYGWPIYVMAHTFGVCHLRCCCLPYPRATDAEVVDDNCCRCNFAALQKLGELGDIEVIYATYHVDVGETPFFVALDYDRRNVVVSIRGTLSMKDILTDLNAEGECLPVTPVQEDWLGHKGMVQAAQYIWAKLKAEALIERALNYAPEKGTNTFQLVCVGHSLGAGTASILSILLRQEYPDLLCYCYSPPGGLLSMPAVEYTKSFTISVVMGKDVVPRIGLHQMEAMRADLINAIKRSVDPKWKTITCSVFCCGCGPEPTSAVEMSTQDATVCEYMRAKDKARCHKVHPVDSSIALTSHQPLYPPGRIIHVVRHHPSKEQAFSSKEPVYQALWAQNTDFDEVLISPVMIQDHMPDKVLDALNKVITTRGPRKPVRRQCAKEADVEHSKVLLVTSFTSLQSPPPSAVHSNASSLNGYNTITKVIAKPTTKPMSLDLIHDDWFGLAPLASPESLSELSSISSRSISCLELKTPKVMRRTPKIGHNLSTCADDLQSVRYYEKLGAISKHLNLTGGGGGMEDKVGLESSSSNLSFASASSRMAEGSSGVHVSSDDFQSVEDVLDAVMESAGCADFFNNPTTPTRFLETHFDEQFEANLANDPDPDVLSNIAIDLCRTPSSSDTKYVTFNPQVINIEELKSAPPVGSPPPTTTTTKRRKWTFMPRKRGDDAAARVDFTPKTILSSKRNSVDNTDDCFARTEALPLLATLGVTSNERTSPSFVQRKKYVYPTPLTFTPNGGGESSV